MWYSLHKNLFYTFLTTNKLYIPDGKTDDLTGCLRQSAPGSSTKTLLIILIQSLYRGFIHKLRNICFKRIFNTLFVLLAQSGLSRLDKMITLSYDQVKTWTTKAYLIVELLKYRIYYIPYSDLHNGEFVKLYIDH